MLNWAQFTAETFHPIRAIPFFIKITRIMLMILIVTIILRYFYKQNKLPCYRRDIRDIPYLLPLVNGNSTLMEQMQKQINNLRQ
jgi:hypothetical protein